MGLSREVGELVTEGGGELGERAHRPAHTAPTRRYNPISPTGCAIYTFPMRHPHVGIEHGRLLAGGVSKIFNHHLVKGRAQGDEQGVSGLEQGVAPVLRLEAAPVGGIREATAREVRL